MGYDFDNNTPIYMQIVEYIKLQIIKGDLAPNQRLPSVRDLSIELGANPNTVQKALAELEDMGLIFTERTNGKFVTMDTNIINKVSQQTVHKMIGDFYSSMQRLGLDKDEVLHLLNNYKE